MPTRKNRSLRRATLRSHVSLLDPDLLDRAMLSSKTMHELLPTTIMMIWCPTNDHDEQQEGNRPTFLISSNVCGLTPSSSKVVWQFSITSSIMRWYTLPCDEKTGFQHLRAATGIGYGAAARVWHERTNHKLVRHPAADPPMYCKKTEVDATAR